MAKSANPPHIVRELMRKGCMGEFARGRSAFNPDESVGLVRYLARLLQERSAESGDRLVETVRAVAEVSVARHREPRPLACAKGCAHCCYQAVSVSAPEAFAIARGLRKTSERWRAAMADRAAVNTAEASDSVFSRDRPCVFLVDSVCAIHPARPLACRLYVSFDAMACARRLDDDTSPIPVPIAQDAIRTWLRTALWTAHGAAGLEPRSYRLDAAIAVLLADPGIEARWYAGEDALAVAADPPLHASDAAQCAQLKALARL